LVFSSDVPEYDEITPCTTCNFVYHTHNNGFPLPLQQAQGAIGFDPLQSTVGEPVKLEFVEVCTGMMIFQRIAEDCTSR